MLPTRWLPAALLTLCSGREITAQALLCMCELVYATCMVGGNAQVGHWLPASPYTLWQPRAISGTAI